MFAKLKALDIPTRDIAQVLEAEKYLTCDVNDKRIGKREARERLGEYRYWHAMHRAAFHWTAAMTDDAGNEYYFDCGDYFRK